MTLVHWRHWPWLFFHPIFIWLLKGIGSRKRSGIRQRCRQPRVYCRRHVGKDGRDARPSRNYGTSVLQRHQEHLLPKTYLHALISILFARLLIIIKALFLTDVLFPLSYCSRRKCQKRPRSWNSRHQFGNEGRNGKEIRERNRILSLRVWETGAGHQDEQNDSETITNKLNQNKINKTWVMTLSQIWHRLSCKSPSRPWHATTIQLQYFRKIFLIFKMWWSGK